MFGQFLCNMYRKIIFFLGVDYFDSLEFVYQYTGVAYLATALCIERSVVQYDLIQSLVFLFYLAITQDGSFVFRVIVTYKLSSSFFQYDPVTCLYGSCIAGTLFLLLHFGIELFDIDCHTIFTQNQLCQVEWETECIV